MELAIHSRGQRTGSSFAGSSGIEKLAALQCCCAHAIHPASLQNALMSRAGEVRPCGQTTTQHCCSHHGKEDEMHCCCVQGETERRGGGKPAATTKPCAQGTRTHEKRKGAVAPARLPSNAEVGLHDAALAAATKASEVEGEMVGLHASAAVKNSALDGRAAALCRHGPYRLCHSDRRRARRSGALLPTGDRLRSAWLGSQTEVRAYTTVLCCNSRPG